MTRILIVDDEPQLVEAFKKKLSKEGMDVASASDAQEALSLLKKETFDVGLFDIRLPDMDGVELLGLSKEMQPGLEVIMLTGYASIDTAIKSMKLGAYDYLTKPCKLSELHNIILKAYEKKSLREKNTLLEAHLQRVGVHDEFLGESKGIKEVKRLISLVASSEVPVLVLGETGTGKELVAHAIHDLSPRSKNPFVTVSSGNLQENILESEIFGYKKGAFTGAQSDKIGLMEIAHKGTFFIDETGDMGSSVQAKFLRVIETGTFRKVGDIRETRVDVRFICATNKVLEDEVRTGRFRQDLFYRFNTFIIKLPPLRERKEDIPLLADYFLQKFTRGQKRKRLSQGAMTLLMAYDWPGNVRELANVLERSTLLCGSREQITVNDLPENMVDVRPREVEIERQKFTSDSLELAYVQREHIARVLKSVNGNKSKAARLLGISRKKLYQDIAEATPETVLPKSGTTR
jgi:two-component system, NtrC family, response regulator AtoC